MEDSSLVLSNRYYIEEQYYKRERGHSYDTRTLATGIKFCGIQGILLQISNIANRVCSFPLSVCVFGTFY